MLIRSIKRALEEMSRNRLFGTSLSWTFWLAKFDPAPSQRAWVDQLKFPVPVQPPYIISHSTCLYSIMPPTLPPPTGEAFALVRKLLSSRPKLFQEILQEGIAAHPSSANPRQPKPPRQPRRLASGRYAQEASETYLPEGHPFVSAS